jgi:hypothetical protein
VKDADEKATKANQLYEAERDWEIERLSGYEREVAAAEMASQKRMEMIEDAKRAGLDVDEAATQSILLYYQQTGDAEANQYERIRRIQIEDKNRKLQLQAQYVQGASTMFGNLAESAKAFGKKGYAAFKAFATAQALVNTYASAVGAYNAMVSIPYVGPALAVAAAAAAVAAGLANVAQINSQNPNVAHGGLERVPNEATYLLQEGERVVQPRQNEQLGEFLERQAAGGYGNGGDVYLDGRKVGKVLWDMMRNGTLKIHSGAIA